MLMLREQSPNKYLWVKISIIVIAVLAVLRVTYKTIFPTVVIKHSLDWSAVSESSAVFMGHFSESSLQPDGDGNLYLEEDNWTESLSEEHYAVTVNGKLSQSKGTFRHTEPYYVVNMPVLQTRSAPHLDRIEKRQRLTCSMRALGFRFPFGCGSYKKYLNYQNGDHPILYFKFHDVDLIGLRPKAFSDNIEKLSK
jgi:hypothetical protein